MPFREKKGRLWGPGRAGYEVRHCILLFAVRALRELDIPVARRVLLQVNSDEEVGSEYIAPTHRRSGVA